MLNDEELCRKYFSYFEKNVSWFGTKVCLQECNAQKNIEIVHKCETR